jgi:hypothetical protein
VNNFVLFHKYFTEPHKKKSDEALSASMELKSRPVSRNGPRDQKNSIKSTLVSELNPTESPFPFEVPSLNQQTPKRRNSISHNPSLVGILSPLPKQGPLYETPKRYSSTLLGDPANLYDAPRSYTPQRRLDPVSPRLSKPMASTFDEYSKPVKSLSGYDKEPLTPTQLKQTKTMSPEFHRQIYGHNRIFF